MSVFSLAIPAIKEYLNAKAQVLVCKDRSRSQKLFWSIFWVLSGTGAIFGLSCVYEYYIKTYTPIVAKAYMAVTFFALAIISGVVYLIIKGIMSFFKRRKKSSDVPPVHQYAQDALKIIETEGLSLIKNHPFIAILIGLSVGVLSGITSLPKHRLR